ncbi:hypothetical protein CHARACLAT_020962 [Characodon lateralis]|uniref:Uncharacterized protein n=1 Tax=Characodon lateralis TaxID=208331 RepID=A0ABU7D037_9TELE|nr:hypothetical protein [Characodon lateralis]
MSVNVQERICAVHNELAGLDGGREFCKKGIFKHKTIWPPALSGFFFLSSPVLTKIEVQGFIIYLSCSGSVRNDRAQAESNRLATSSLVSSTERMSPASGWTFQNQRQVYEMLTGCQMKASRHHTLTIFVVVLLRKCNLNCIRCHI